MPKGQQRATAEHNAELALTQKTEAQVAKATAEAASTAAVEARDTAQAANTAQVKALNDLAANLQTNLTAQAAAMQPPSLMSTATARATPTGTPTPAASTPGAPSQALSPTPTGTPTPPEPILPPTPNRTVVAQQTQLAQVRATQTALAVAPQTQVYAIIDGFDTRLNIEPAIDAPPAALVHAPAKLRVVKANENFWVQVETSGGDLGWIDGRWITYEGDANLLPKELRHRNISNRGDLPFVHGVIVSPDGNQEQYPLLDQPQEDAAIAASIPVGTQVTILLRARGSSAYGSGQWYIVTLPDPSGQRVRWTGYLPVEVVAPSP